MANDDARGEGRALDRGADEHGRGGAGAAVPPDLPRAVGDVLERIRARAPAVHASMNSVAQPFVANVLTALGADVSMTSAPGEVAEMVARADALLLNLGTLDRVRSDGILEAVAAAGQAGIPVVLDPVKVDRAPRRLAFAEGLLRAGTAVVKGNPAEMAALRPARTPGPGWAVTGRDDVVEADGVRIRLRNGTPLLARVIATGCACGAVVAAAAAVERSRLLAAVAGLSIWSVAAEIAAEGDPGPGTFAVRILDAVAGLGPGDLEERMRFGHD